LNGLAREPNMAGVDIFAHSMGNWLTLETLRQIAIGGNERTLDRIGQVVLAAPDVDMEVFRTQIGRLGALRSRITLYSSKDDHALQLSRRLFGGKIRAGENTDMAEFEKLGIQAHDLSDVKGGLGKNHGKAFGDGTTIGVIGRSMNNGAPLRQQGDIVSNGVAEVGRTITRAANILRPTSE
jgi:esterase/lipase superfamily enzyme